MNETINLIEDALRIVEDLKESNAERDVIFQELHKSIIDIYQDSKIINVYQDAIIKEKIDEVFKFYFDIFKNDSDALFMPDDEVTKHVREISFARGLLQGISIMRNRDDLERELKIIRSK